MVSSSVWLPVSVGLLVTMAVPSKKLLFTHYQESHHDTTLHDTTLHEDRFDRFVSTSCFFFGVGNYLSFSLLQDITLFIATELVTILSITACSWSRSPAMFLMALSLSNL